MSPGAPLRQFRSTMPSLPQVGWTVFFLLLLWERLAALSTDMGCLLVGPVGAQHPVQGLMEKFEAGPGCAARERGNKETHVIGLRRVTKSPENKVTVLLKPLSVTPSLLRTIHLVLSSKVAVTWLLEAEQLSPNLPVLVQVSPNSSVQSQTLRFHVQAVHSLPLRPFALHRWALKHHGNLSSLIHTTQGNRVYIRLGEDPNQPALCQLEPRFLSDNYMISDLQPQTVKGCSCTPMSPEVHMIKLHSAGYLHGKVIVSLVSPVASAKSHKVVLILSSSEPVSWTIASHGVQGHIHVHSSNSVSPPSPPEPDLTLSSTLDSDLSTTSDLLVWADEKDYKVTSYTEAGLANHFVIHLAEDKVAAMNSLVMKPLRVEESRLRQWLNTGEGQESFTVKCEGGLLSVTVDQQSLQSLSLPVAAMTLQDQRCQALFNGSHFLLALPVIFCRTEAVLVGEPRGVQYKNTVLLWKDETQTTVALSETEMSKRPLSIPISCFFAIAAHPAATDDNVTLPLIGRFPSGLPQGSESDPEIRHLPTHRHRSGPALALKLSVTETYEQTCYGPCVITADHRVYVEISAEAPLADVVQVKSCFLSPQSNPKKSPFWTVISNGCSSDPSLTLITKMKGELKEELEGQLEEENTETERNYHKERKGSRMAESWRSGEKHPLRFSFILRPVFNDSMQFLHCSVLLCVSDSTKEKTMKEVVKNDCQGRTHIPLLGSRSPSNQCEIRNLSRPMVVTHPMTSLAPKMWTLAGQKTKRLDPELQTGPVMGIALAAFAIGVGLMGGLWCIYNHTGGRPVYFREGHLTDQTRWGHNIGTPPSPSDQSSSSV
ncbi:transforming growth factor beta receptor type 3 isoform X2 [Melanotaenia boesemani]|uniref:transforming growth factor beta receptor type 3 isoform X2 n=1 Tax=Melanotaenia boesemani TaxID=1250792 RepID=UPI001C04BA8C|nr:transforming growth factor beta receptor type 3 isoform X2 [Melanotaenia boesemani]